MGELLRSGIELYPRYEAAGQGIHNVVSGREHFWDVVGEGFKQEPLPDPEVKKGRSLYLSRADEY